MVIEMVESNSYDILVSEACQVTRHGLGWLTYTGVLDFPNQDSYFYLPLKIKGRLRRG
jgi:hypothetical protein